MRFSLFIITLVLMTFVMGCECKDSKEEVPTKKTYTINLEVNYFQDSTTGLCFAYHMSRSYDEGYLGLTEVSCDKACKKISEIECPLEAE